MPLATAENRKIELARFHSVKFGLAINEILPKVGGKTKLAEKVGRTREFVKKVVEGDAHRIRTETLNELVEAVRPYAGDDHCLVLTSLIKAMKDNPPS